MPPTRGLEAMEPAGGSSAVKMWPAVGGAVEAATVVMAAPVKPVVPANVVLGLVDVTAGPVMHAV